MPDQITPTSSPSPAESRPAANGILTRPVTPGKGAAGRGNASSGGTGEGRDRRIEKKLWTPKRIAIAAIAGLLVTMLVWALLTQTGGRRLAVERDRLTISVVERAPFQEYIAVTGNVMPIRTVFLDAVMGGHVEERYVEAGAFVQAGQPIVRLANDQQMLQMLSSEAAMQEQINNIRTTRLALDQNELNLRQQVAELEYQVHMLQRQEARERELAARGAIPQNDYSQTRDQYEYLRRRLALTQQSYRQDSLMRATQLRQMDAQVVRLEQNLGLLRSSFDNLTIRAPISGQLSALDAEVGASRAAGSRIGQIDDLSGWRVRVPIDEHYIARVAPGLRGTVTIGGEDIALEVMQVYPEVRDGRFEVDMDFMAAAPAVRRGQSLRIRLELGDPEDALLLSRGGFFTATGGHWVFVLNQDASEAARRPIRLGRQNPMHFEVLDGLQPGDRVVTSGYDTFGDADRLILR
jgi:HlyD family secretion protein